MRTLRGERGERVPLWIMRQAGRHLPEYRRLRAAAGTFCALLRTPELACEATLQPVRRYGLDAAIVFSDILAVPDALGLGLEFAEHSGPRLASPLRDEQAVRRLGPPDGECLAQAARTVTLCKSRLPPDVPLIGFAGAPFTLACYMVEGEGGDFGRARAMLLSRPDLFDAVLHSAADAAAASLAEQARAGADALMVFDSWAALAPRGMERQCLLGPCRRLLTQLRRRNIDAPAIVFPRGREDLARALADAGYDTVGVGWQADLGAVCAKLGGTAAVQGNLDPAVLLAEPGTIRNEARKVLAAAEDASAHVFNLGHGIRRDTDPDMVAALVEAVRELSSGK